MEDFAERSVIVVTAKAPPSDRVTPLWEKLFLIPGFQDLCQLPFLLNPPSPRLNPNKKFN